MSTKVDIQDFKRKHEGALLKLEESPLLETNKKVISEFDRYCLFAGISYSRRIRCMITLVQLASHFNKNFEDINKEDMVAYMVRLESLPYKDWTKHTFKSIIRKFFKWFKGNNEFYPPEISWLKAPKKGFEHKLPEDLLTKEEAVKLLNRARTIRDKAFISSLFESGCRISELGNMLIKNVVFDQFGTVIVVDGKTGMRRVRLIDSTPYLANWIDNHPFKEDPNNPLWAGSRRKGNALSYQALAKILKETALEAGIRKKVNPHIFRHSRATINANFLTEAQMNHYFGWTQGSRMPSIYVHMSGRDLDATLINMHHPNQRVVMNKAAENTFSPKGCPRCQQQNPSTSKFCNRCGGALELQEVLS